MNRRLFDEAGDAGDPGAGAGAGKAGIEGAEAARAAAADKAAADKAASDKAAGDKAASDKAAADKAAADKAAGQKAVPEKYEFKAEDGHELDQELVGEFSGIAKEAGLTQENAGKIFAVGQKLVKRQEQAFEKHVSDTRAKWVDEVKNDPVLGANLVENLAVAKKAIAAADTDGQLVKWLNESGAGDNPALVRAFYKLGKMIASDKLVTGDRKPAGNTAGPRVFSYANSDHK